MMAGFLDLVGLAGFGVAVAALIRGHLNWARISDRRIAAAVFVAALMLLAIGGTLGPATSTSTATGTEPTTSTPTAVATPTPSPPVVPPSATSQAGSDPEANPTSTAHINTSGLVIPPAQTVAKSACRTGSPLANVYHPYRLQVVSDCSTVAGTVETVRHEADGDYHIDLALDPAYTGMLDAANTTYQHGWLVVEIVPADEPGCTVGKPPKPASGTYNYGICTGADEIVPAVGTHVFVTGPYVVDLWHDWTEIHPAWAINVTVKPTAPPATTSSAPPPPPPSTSTASSPLTCTAHMTNTSPTQYSTTTVVVATGVAGAQVTTTAHYKTTDTTHTGVADSAGTAEVPYKISRATIGYTVVVDVTATNAGHSATCTTSFTPVS